jgi:HK97 family phage major capsid protein
MASEWTTARRHDRISELRSQLADMDREAGGEQFDRASRDTWNELNTELDSHKAALDELHVREQRLSEAMADPNPERREVGFGGGGGRTSTIVGNAEGWRSQALRTIDRYRNDLPTDAGDRLDAHVREGDALGLDAKYLHAVGTPEYESAFVKMLRDPQTGHLRFSEKEVSAVRAVSQVEQERAMAVGTGSTGGFGAPFALDPSIMVSGTGSINPLRQIGRVETINGYEWRGISADQISAHYRAEATEVADDSPTLVQPIVTPRRGDAFVPISIEVEQDYATLVQELGKLLADARDQLDAAKFVTGVPGSNEPVGILSVGQTGALTTSQRVQTADAAAFAVGDPWLLKAQVPPRFVANTSVVANPRIFDLTYRFTGGNAAEPPIMPTRDGACFGRPAFELSTMVSTTTTASRIMIAGDFKQFVIGDRLGFQVELVPHLFGATNRYPTGQRGVLAIWRTGSAVVVPNGLRYLEVA